MRMTDTPKTVPPEVIEALKRGDKAGAMKMLLQGNKITGLKDVMQLLQKLQSSGALDAVKVNIKSSARTDALPPGVLDAMRQGNKIEAIRLLREATGAGLVEAKGTIESFEASMVAPAASREAPVTTKPAAHPHPMPVSSVPAEHDGLSPGEVPRTNAKAMGFVVALVIALVVIWLALK